MQLAWTSSPALLATLASLALKVLLNTIQKVKSCKKVGHLRKSVSHTQSGPVGHLKLVLFCLIITYIHFVDKFYKAISYDPFNMTHKVL